MMAFKNARAMALSVPGRICSQYLALSANSVLRGSTTISLEIPHVFNTLWQNHRYNRALHSHRPLTQFNSPDDW
jgi:hypothetical protein